MAEPVVSLNLISGGKEFRPVVHRSAGPMCDAKDCSEVADFSVMANGDYGCFEGNLCRPHYDHAVAILRPSILSAAFLHIITFEELDAALRRDFPQEGPDGRSR